MIEAAESYLRSLIGSTPTSPEALRFTDGCCHVGVISFSHSLQKVRLESNPVASREQNNNHHFLDCSNHQPNNISLSYRNVSQGSCLPTEMKK